MLRIKHIWESRRRLGIITFILIALVASITVGAIKPAKAATTTLWNNTTTPATLSDPDTASVELGLKFRSSTAGYITGVKFYKSTANTGTHTGTLWSSSGSQLASVTFTNESASGWQSASFGTPVAITANTTYVVSYHAPNGHYSSNANYFASQAFTNGPLTALKSGTDGPNGVYKYDSAVAFPTDSYQATNYWVDPIFSDTAPADTTPPTVSSTTPANNATNVSINVQPKAVFNENLNASTVSSSTVELRKTSDNSIIASTISYDTATNTVTAVPQSSLAAQTGYTLTLKGGGTDPRIKDVAGNALASNTTVAFTTGTANAQYSLWQPAAQSVSVANDDSENVELGTKFSASTNGTIHAISFYKGSTDPASTHTVTLWSSNGTALGTATTSSETASGWQTATFSSPIAIAGGATYVASYRTPNGHYSLTSGGLTNAFTNGPLTALANGGVYKYGGGYPTSTWNSTNYWVDVVFSEGGTTPATPINPLTQGPGGPILVLQNPDKPLSGYASEILRAEGLNSFATASINTLTASTLTGYSVVVLGDTPVTASQVTTLTNWVNAGGNLIAFRPDKQLANLLGLTDQNSTLSEGYIGIDTSEEPGAGITNQTIQFHGTADRYTTTSGTRTIATLYSNPTTATTNPAVTLRSVGTSGGQAVAFTYDLASSIVLTHQGNPAWAGQDRDGSTPIRTNDLFFGNKAGDSQPDYVNLDKVAIPQADEQQRLLANTISYTNQDKTPLPKFWYFPNDKKAVMVMAGDDHSTGSGTKDSFDYLTAQSPANCVVANWECFRATSYIYANTPLTDSAAASYNSQGFDLGSHISTGCADFTPESLANSLSGDLAAFRSAFPSLPNQTGSRTHCIVWSDYDSTPKVEYQNGIRIDLNYYYWPASWVNNRPGFMTGSGMTMRYTDAGGNLLDVYQKASDLVNEAGNFQNPANIDKQLDRALGPEGYYGAIGTHYDYSDTFDRQLVQSAKARNVPIVSVKQLMSFTDGRNASKFSTPTWTGNVLGFTTTVDSKAGSIMKSMLPIKSSKGILQSITKDGSNVSFTTDYRKGVLYAIFPAASGTYAATYAADTTAPTISSTTPANNATGVAIADKPKAVFSEYMDATTFSSSTVELRKTSDNSLVATTTSFDYANKTLTVTPTGALAGNTGYTLTIKGGATDPRVKDLAGNALAANKVVTFTTAAAQYSLWYPAAQTVSVATTDTASVELGVKFSSSAAGAINGIAFYKGSSDPANTHTVTLWDAAGTAIGTATTNTETASGWQTATFTTPVTITAGTTYTASYRAPNGNYSYTSGNLTSPFTNGSLTVPANGGVYNYSTGVPTGSFGGANYWVDVIFTEN